MLEESRPVESFEFIGGRLCLDFVNTLSDRWKTTPVEVLDTYTDLLIWGRLARALDSKQARQLQLQAEQEPALAASWLAEIKGIRALLYQILSKVAAGEAPVAEEIGQFNQYLSTTMAYLRVTPDKNGFTWQWHGQEARHELPLWPVIRDAADLLTSSELRFVRMCASDTCDWLFLDTSKNHKRRWCDMDTCGNRAKARRHYGRQKQTSQP
ncbi:MAG TPA: ABATE domain-containing protein [Ktedonobacteraceae bacterium]